MINLRKFARAVFSGGIKGHFGQWAEDVLVRKLFPVNKVDGVYLDIGSYHPFIHSNTAYLWMKGWRGYNIDANPSTIHLFEKIRPQDVNIWTAIIPHADYEGGVHEVLLMLPGVSDSSSGIAAAGTVNNLVGNERGFSKSKKVPATSVKALIESKQIANVDYLNIDIEGCDEIILTEIDFKVIKPSVVTIEDYSEKFSLLISSKITKLMELNNYSLMGRAGPTSIFQKIQNKN